MQAWQAANKLSDVYLLQAYTTSQFLFSAAALLIPNIDRNVLLLLLLEKVAHKIIIKYEHKRYSKFADQVRNSLGYNGIETKSRKHNDSIYW